MHDTRGQRRLWLVFWIQGVLVSNLMLAVILYEYRQVGTVQLSLMLVGFLAYTFRIMGAVWVNAFNVRNEFHGHVARALTVTWLLNAVLLCAFLFLDHLDLAAMPF